jgi:alpha-1,4-digalacturonate transport system permease protein
MSKKYSSFKRRQLERKMAPYWFVAPNVIIFTTFSILPILMGISYSFTKFDGLADPVFIGLANYKKLITDLYFISAMKETAILVSVLVPTIFIFSLTLAYIMTRNLKAKGFFRVSFYWPVMVSAIIVGVMWQWIFGDTIGLLNGVRRAMGLSNMKTLTNPFFARLIVLFAILWSRAGYYMVMFMGGLQSISGSLYEAATIDGASKRQQFRLITFPLLKPTSLMVFILMSMYLFKTYALVKALTNGGPYRATTYVVQHIYETAFERWSFGYASSMSVVMMGVVLLFTLFSFYVSKGGET